MLNRKIELGILVIIITCYGYGSYMFGYNAKTETRNDYFWIDNNRYEKGSTVDASPIFNDTGDKIGMWVRVVGKQSTIHVECLDENGYIWEDFYNSFIQSFKEGSI